MRNAVEIRVFDDKLNQWKKLRTFADESIKISQTVKDVKDLGKVRGALAVQFTLPADNRNNQFFRHWHDYRVVNITRDDAAFDARFSIPAQILVNGVLYEDGVLSLLGVNVRYNNPTSYRVQFSSKLRSLKETIGDDILSGLPYLDNWDHQYSEQNVHAALQGGVSFGGSVSAIGSVYDCIYPLISAGRLYDFNTDIRHFDVGGTGAGTVGLRYQDFKPAIGIDAILDAIADKYDNLDFDWKFIDSDTAFTNRFFMWCHRAKGVMNSAEGDYQETTIPHSDWSYTSGTAHSPITVTSSTTYQIRFSIVPEESGGAASTKAYGYEIFDEITGETIVSVDKISGGVTPTFILPYTGNTSRTYELGLRVFTTDGLYQVRAVQTRWIVDDPDTMTPINSGIYDHGPTNYVVFSNVKIRSQIPEMKVIDFLTSLIKMFNLVVYYDKVTEKIVFDFWKDWASQSANEWTFSGQDGFIEHDWSVEPTKLYSRVNFKFKEAQTFLAIERNKSVNSTDDYGNLSYDVNRQYFTGTEEYNIELGFEKMLFTRFTDDNSGDLTDVNFGFALDENFDPVDTKPVIFFLNRTLGAADSLEWYNQGYAGAALTTLNRPSNEDPTDDFTLNFNAEIGDDSFEIEEESLFKKYWADYIDRIFNVQSRKVKLKGYFNQNFMMNVNMWDKVRWNAGMYVINKIDVDLTSGYGTIELIPDL